ncbi:unnamed protein product [Adineta ricciae]|uniref:Uncharacterized protein n=1 Tax=Adineta ricciae TaxID=249248 RepID=A0A815WH74_ADIRI|nr:unnamed protein product [Adineta ricciae]
MLHIWESVPHTESVPTIPELTRSNSGIDTHNSAEFLPIPESIHTIPRNSYQFRNRYTQFRGIPTNSGITPTPYTLTYHLPYTRPNSVYGIPEFSHPRNR